MVDSGERRTQKVKKKICPMSQEVQGTPAVLGPIW